MSAEWGGAVASHNYPIPLREIKVEDGMVPFWVENQGNWVWAYDPTAEGHAVYERDPSVEPHRWSAVGERLSEFLIHATVVEAILNAPAMKIAQGVRAEWLWSRAEVKEFPYPAWRWPERDSRIFFGDAWMALVHRSGDLEDLRDITLAATAPADLIWAENVAAIKWRSYNNLQDSVANEPPPW
ncbi:hypothetical protein ACFYZT_32340 [Streptomyces sp. NPDC001591]